MARTQVLIASPLEAELVARIQASEPRAEVRYEPDLLPPARYPADHLGDPAFRRDAEGEARWRALLEEAEVLFGIPGDSAEGLAEVVTGLSRLRWVHATSADRRAVDQHHRPHHLARPRPDRVRWVAPVMRPRTVAPCDSAQSSITTRS